MVSNAVAGTISVRLPAEMMASLRSHLFRADADEHGAVIGASVVETQRGMRLLGRRLFIAQDAIDYVPGERGYRMLTPGFVRRCVRACAEERLAYLAVHNHAGTDTVAFSRRRHGIASTRIPGAARHPRRPPCGCPRVREQCRGWRHLAD